MFFTSEDVEGEDGVLSVDHASSLSAMMDRANFDWVNPNICQDNFPINGLGAERFQFYLAEDPKTSNEDSQGSWMDASIEHLLALHVSFPELQEQHSIAALAAVCTVDGMQKTPYLVKREQDEGGDIDLHCLNIAWPTKFRFLKVRRCRPQP